jgi:hypothetical protein
MPQPRVVIAGEVYKTQQTGSKTIGTSAVVIGGNVPASDGILVVAAGTNTGIVYVGGSAVTANTDNNNDGIPIVANSAVKVRVDNVNKVYAISDTASQKIYWMVENIQG